MRYILFFWAAPLGLFWGWFYLSSNDINFGSIYLSRGLNELVFELYGSILGIDPEAIPALIAKACLLDTGLILAIFAYRRRREIMTRVADYRGRLAGPLPAESGEADPARPEG